MEFSNKTASWGSYPSIYNMGHKAITGILEWYKDQLLRQSFEGSEEQAMDAASAADHVPQSEGEVVAAYLGESSE